MELVKLTHELVKFKVYTWEEANITAMIVPSPSIDLLAAQISQGYDQDGKQVYISHYQSRLTNIEG